MIQKHGQWMPPFEASTSHLVGLIRKIHYELLKPMETMTGDAIDFSRCF